MGKRPYTKLLPTLPKFRIEDAHRQQKINETIHNIVKEVEEADEPMTAVALAKRFRLVRRRRDWLKKVLGIIQIQVEAYTALLEKYYEVEGVKSIKLSDRSSVRLQDELYSKVTDHAAFQKWCIDNGLLNKLRMQWNSMNAIAKERLDEGLELPPGVEATTRVKPVLGKGDDEPVIDESWLDDFADEQEEEDEF